MKHLLSIVLLGFALSLCNLSSKLTSKSSGGSGGASESSKPASTAPVEHAEPNAEQAAALAGGKQVTWAQQGISFTVPPNWTESTNETKMLVWTSPGSWGAASLIVNISPMAEDFPTDISLNAFYESAKNRSKNGEVDEVKWLEIDGLKGLQFRESNPEKPDDQRRLQWMAYRKYAGQVQLVNLMLATQAKDFARHHDAMYGILYSTKVVH